jgi:MFS family permease
MTDATSNSPTEKNGGGITAKTANAVSTNGAAGPNDRPNDRPNDHGISTNGALRQDDNGKQPPSPPKGRGRLAVAQDPYKGKWITLSNTTLGILMATINSSIILISLPDIFRGIHLNPLVPSNTSLFLWLLMGYLVVTAVLVVSFGRLGDMFGRVKMYNLGFAVFSFFSILLAIDWMHGTSGALWLIIMRVFQGVGGALLFANSAAILTDAFPEDERGLALGINNVAAIAGTFIGLILGGLLGPVDWRLVFLISVPIGIFGTVWAYISLHDKGVRTPSKLDWWGNTTFAAGLIILLVGISYGILPYGHSNMGWGNPWVIAALVGGIAILALFAWIETKVDNPMFKLKLFRIRAFTAGNFASLLASLGRGGMMFILIIWLQGIWLPQHGYNFVDTPLWAGIYMLPLTAGFMASGPLSGYLSDRFGARPFATGGMIGAAASFALLELLPANFPYPAFALLLLLNGLAMGLFASPNRAGIMNSLPPNQRGAGAGMVATFQNSAMVLSIGVFFTLIILGLSSTLPTALYSGLVAHGVPVKDAMKVSHLPPTGALFAAFLGYNPMKELLGPTGAFHHLSHAQASLLTGRKFFPKLISPPFMSGLREAFDFAAVACLIAAIASWLRGGKFVYSEETHGHLFGATPANAGTSAGDAQGSEIPAGQIKKNAMTPGNGQGAPSAELAKLSKNSGDADASLAGDEDASLAAAKLASEELQS